MNLLRNLSIRIGREANPEDVLVAEAKRGNRQAFDELVQIHQNALRGFLIRRAGLNAADDIMQDTWYACWTSLHSFTGRSRFKVWLFSIALNKCIDYARSNKRKPLETVIIDENDLSQVDQNPYAASDLRESIQSILSSLPEAQREVIEMYYYGELTLPEIAIALKRNLNSVKYQFYRAHALVAQGLQDGEVSPDVPLKDSARKGSVQK